MERSGEQDVTGLELAKPFQSSEPAASSRRPKLLFLARPFPPARYTACVRTANIAKYLARLGWDVTVVTLHPDLWRYADNFEETERLLTREQIQRITTGHSWRFLQPEILKTNVGGFASLLGGVCRGVVRYFEIDRSFGWASHIYRACSSLKSNDVDVIFATGSPFVSFEVARQLSQRLSKPFVLDYRDPWTGNPHQWLERRRIIRKEKVLLRDCAAVTIVSPSWGAALQRRFLLNSKLHIVTNGYDPEEMSIIKPYEFGHFAIVYTGVFYPPKRVITPVFAALKLLNEQRINRDWKFHYYGKDEDYIREEGRIAGLMDHIVIHGNVPRSEALSAVCGANLSVVITSVTEDSRPEDNGIVPGKIFESLGLRVPTLLIAPPGSDAAVMAQNSTLISSHSGIEVQNILASIREFMTSGVPCDEYDSDYAWPVIAGKLDAVLRRAAHRKAE